MLGDKPIRIEFVTQSSQAYPTVGDYMAEEVDGDGDGYVLFRITRLSRPAYSIAILLHELVEKYLNDRDGVTDMQVNDWDMGEGAEMDDPGLHPRAPYHRQHMCADAIERMFIIMAGEDWTEYESAITALFGSEKDTGDGK